MVMLTIIACFFLCIFDIQGIEKNVYEVEEKNVMTGREE